MHSSHSKKVPSLVGVFLCRVCIYLSAWIFYGYSSFLSQSRNMQIAIRLVGDSQLSWMWVWIVVCLYFPALWFSGDLSKVNSATCPMSAEIIGGEIGGWTGVHPPISFRTTFLFILSYQTFIDMHSGTGPSLLLSTLNMFPLFFIFILLELYHPVCL